MEIQMSEQSTNKTIRGRPRKYQFSDEELVGERKIGRPRKQKLNETVLPPVITSESDSESKQEDNVEQPPKKRGRKKLVLTEEQILERIQKNREKAARSYHRYKEDKLAAAKQYYYDNKQDILDEKHGLNLKKLRYILIALKEGKMQVSEL